MNNFQIIDGWAFNWFYNVGVFCCSAIFAIWVGLLLLILKYKYESWKSDRDIRQAHRELKIKRFS